jgi:HEAT repeat protein
VQGNVGIQLAYGALICWGVTVGNVPAMADDSAAPINSRAYPCSDQKLLENAGVRTDQKSLIEFLANHSNSDGDLAKLDQFVRMLGDKQFKAREEAARTVIAIGPAALSKLHMAKRGLDPELSARASACIEQIVKSSNTELPRAAARLLMKSPDVAAFAALLRYLPYASEPEVGDEIWFHLDQVVVHNGAMIPQLVSSIRDLLPARRALAGCIIGHRGSSAQRKLVSKLLLDTEPAVRLRTAQGLLAANDVASILPLIDLLTDESLYIAWQAEELLRWARPGDSPPELIGGGSPISRQLCQAAWRRWWAQTGKALPSLKPSAGPRVTPSLRLVVESANENESDKPARGRVWLCGSDGQLRWELTDLEEPSYAYLLPSHRVLVQERGHRNHLAEYDLPGRLLQKRHLDDQRPLTLQYLSSGALFVASRTCLSELTLEGATIYRCDLLPKALPSISSARTLGDGRILCLSLDERLLLELDHSGKELARRRLPSLPKSRIQGRILSNSHILLTSQKSGEVVEIDRYCNVISQWKAANPLGGCSLPGHRLLLASRLGTFPRIIETDKHGNTIWEALTRNEPVFLDSCFPALRVSFAEDLCDSPLLDTPAYRASQLNSKDSTIQVAALEGLAQLGSEAGPATGALSELLKSPDTTIRVKARNILIRIGSSAIPAVIPLLRHPDPTIRSMAASILGAYRKHAAALAPHLTFLLKDDALSVRLASASALVSLDEATEGVVATLKDLSMTGPSEIRWNAIGTLARAGPRARGAVPLFITILKGSDLQTQLAAAYAIGDLRDVTPAAIAALIEASQRGGPRKLRYAAAHSLGQIGPAAKDALPSLLSILNEEPTSTDVELRDLRRVAVEALTQLRPGDASLVPHLIHALTQFKDPIVVSAALKGLADLGAIAAPAIPVIEETKHVASPEVRRVADQALQSINTSIARRRKSQ